MANLKERPFSNFKTAITDPSYFFGRSELIDKVRQSPFRVRILLGGRRIGKTSSLRALEWNLLDANPDKPRRAFPVFISLQYQQPKDLDNLRYILIERLREAIARWSEITGAALRQMYRQFLRQIPSANITFNFLKTVSTKIDLANPDYERRLIHDDFRQALLKTIDELEKWDFEGVCFLLDEADYIVGKDWANDAWSYFRGLKDNDTALSPFFGLLLSGYRNLKDYQQQVGSPLYNIAEVEWLASLTASETQQLIEHRCREENVSLNREINTVIQWAGCHPYLTQQTLNILFDNYKTNWPPQWQNLFYQLVRQQDAEFQRWWNKDGQTDGFSEQHRSVYHALVQQRQEHTASLAQMVGLSENKVADALEVLAGTGVIRQLDGDQWEVGALLFQQWVEGTADER